MDDGIAPGAKVRVRETGGDFAGMVGTVLRLISGPVKKAMIQFGGQLNGEGKGSISIIANLDLRKLEVV